MTIQQTLGQYLKSLLEKYNLKQSQLADATGLSRSYISLLLKGDRTDPSSQVIRSIATVLTLSPDETETLFTLAGLNPDDILPLVASGGAQVRRRFSGYSYDISQFLDREKHLKDIEQWITEATSKILIIYGLSGIGKTWLAVKVAREFGKAFDHVFWWSLGDERSADDFINELSHAILGSARPHVPVSRTSPASSRGLSWLQTTHLLSLLRDHRCLIVFDNFETAFEEQNVKGSYQSTFAGYAEIVDLVAETEHQSKLVITSRELLANVEAVERHDAPVWAVHLEGIPTDYVRSLVADYVLHGNDGEWQRLTDAYEGNPQAIKLAAPVIRDVFGGHIKNFLEHPALINQKLAGLLDAQFGRLERIERQLLYWLAIRRQPVTVSELASLVNRKEVDLTIVEAVSSLVRRALVIKASDGISLSQQVTEYVTAKIVEAMTTELKPTSVFLEASSIHDYPLMQPTSPNYIVQQQRILLPVLARLSQEFDEKAVAAHLRDILRNDRESRNKGLDSPKSYAVGNLLNLLVALDQDLSDLNLSGYSIRDANLEGITLHNVDATNAYFSDTVFSKDFGSVFGLAYHPNDSYVATGTMDGRIDVWRTRDYKREYSLLDPEAGQQGSSGWIGAVAFDGDGKLLVSGGFDKVVRLWHMKDRAVAHRWNEHSDAIRSVDISEDGEWVASGSKDRSVYLYSTSTKAATRLGEHESGVRAVKFSSDGRWLASSGEDKAVMVWDLRNLGTSVPLHRHSGIVRPVAFSPESTWLASAGHDGLIILWHLVDGAGERPRWTYFTTLKNRNLAPVMALAFNPSDPTRLISGDSSYNIVIWDIRTHLTGERPPKEAEAIQICLPAPHTQPVRAIAFDRRGTRFVTGGEDQSIRFWNTQGDHCLRVIQGYVDAILCVATSHDGRWVATGHQDHNVYVWDAEKLATTYEGEQGERIKPCFSLKEHNGEVWAVDFHPHEPYLISSAGDGSVILWDLRSQDRTPTTLSGDHASAVRAAHFSPDGKRLATGDDGGRLLFWDVNLRLSLIQQRGKALEHEDGVRSVAFSANGQYLASGSEDRGVRIWSVDDQSLQAQHHEHKSEVWAVTFGAEHACVYSAGTDGSIYKWRWVEQNHPEEFGQSMAVRERIYALALTPSGRYLAASGEERNIYIWDLEAASPEIQARLYSSHNGAISSLAFLSENCLTSVSRDGSLRTWDWMGVTNTPIRLGRAPLPYEGLNIRGAKGLSEEKISLLKLGAIEA
jgi:WD40 repeat protein/transcriptional regulator with XRE-family HTH domain